MKRHFYVLVGIYFLSLILSIIGFVVDTDINTNTALINNFEIMALSLFIFSIIAGAVYVLYGTYYLLIKKVFKQKLVE
jgi:hypothetical protein